MHNCSDEEIEHVIRLLEAMNPNADVFAQRRGDGWNVFVGTQQEILEKINENQNTNRLHTA